jgi:hypothetical protein
MFDVIHSGSFTSAEAVAERRRKIIKDPPLTLPVREEVDSFANSLLNISLYCFYS